MARVIFISGACGCGKTTFVNAYSRYLVSRNHKSVYVIHGDDFHRGFVEPEDKDDFSRKSLYRIHKFRTGFK